MNLKETTQLAYERITNVFYYLKNGIWELFPNADAGAGITVNGISAVDGNIDLVNGGPTQGIKAANADGSYASVVLIATTPDNPFAQIYVSNADGTITTAFKIYKDKAVIIKNDGAEKKVTTIDLADDFADDTAAAAGGIDVGEQYHNAGAARVRRT